MPNQMVSLKVSGAKEIRRLARKAETRDARKALRDGHKEAARIVSTRATRTAPRRTGRLAGNVRPLGSLTKAQVAAGGARVPYAGPIHYGWPARGIEPQPFITDAVAEKLGNVRHEIETLYLRVANELDTT